MNDLNTIVGKWYVDYPLSPRGGPFIYNGSYTDPGTLGSPNSVNGASAINNAGQVVGTSESPSAAHAFLYDGTMHDLGTLGSPGCSSGASGINQSGVVTGWSKCGPNYTAMYYDGTMHDLGIESTSSEAADINDAGHIVGFFMATDDRPHAYFWDGATSDIGVDLDGCSSASAVNSFDVVVGFASLDGCTGTAAGWVYSATHGLQMLDDLIDANLGIHLLDIEDINDQGWIVGSAQGPGWSREAVLLIPEEETPTPEPGTTELVTSGFIILSMRWFRRRRDRDELPKARDLRKNFI